MPTIFGLTGSNSLVINPGMIHSWGGAAAPTGWLLCDGSVVSQTVYAALFANIGSAFNIGGEGAGNFRLPDSRGRSVLGAGTGSGLTPRTRGQYLGEENHLLSTPELPSHTHNVSGNTGGFSADHTHSIFFFQANGNDGGASGGGPGTFGKGVNAGTTSGGQSANHSHAFGVTSDNGTGGAGSHNTIHPVLVATVIVKY